MLGQTLSMVASMWDAIGPGLLLAVALPFFLALLVLVVRASVRRVGAND